MRKLFVITVVFLALSAMCSAPSSAQLIDHWSTSEACIQAQTAPFYYPALRHQQALVENEVVRGIPTGSCVNMDLPDRSGGRGWVRIEIGRAFVYDQNTGKALRLLECNNKVYQVVSLPQLVGINGKDGKDGLPGRDGKDGRDGRDGRDGLSGSFKLPDDWKKGFNRDTGPRCGTGCKVLIGAGIGVGVGALLYLSKDKDDDKHEGPEVDTNPPGGGATGAKAMAFHRPPPLMVGVRFTIR